MTVQYYSFPVGSKMDASSLYEIKLTKGIDSNKLLRFMNMVICLLPALTVPGDWTGTHLYPYRPGKSCGIELVRILSLLYINVGLGVRLELSKEPSLCCW